MKIDVSIIIPVYNAGPFIIECLESVNSQQTIANIECIIVDDCSTDDSIDRVLNFMASTKTANPIRMIKHRENQGVSAARNTGVRNAVGEYVYFLDPDDYITPDCIDGLFQLTNKYPNLQIISGDIETFPKKGLCEWISLRNKHIPEYINKPSDIRHIWLDKFPLIVCNKLIHRIWFISNSLFFTEGTRFEDNDWQVKTYDCIENVAVFDKITYFYRQHNNSFTATQSAYSDTVIEIKKINAITKSLCSAKIYDAPILRFIAGKLLYLRACSEPEARNLLKRFNDLIWTNHSAPMRLKLFVAYLLLPRVVMRYGLAQRIINFNALSKSAN